MKGDFLMLAVPILVAGAYLYNLHRLTVTLRALRNLLAAIENGDDLERLNLAIQAARKVVGRG